MKQKPATLGSSFVAKGAAKPVDATKPLMEAVVPTVAKTEEKMQEVLSPKVSPPVSAEASLPMATKSLTVKVDLATYKKLKSHGVDAGGKTNQDIFVESLSMYFKAYKL